MPPFPVLIHCKTVSFVSVRSSSRSSFNIFRDRPNRYGVYTVPKCGTKTYPICDAPLSEIGVVQLPPRHRNRHATINATVLHVCLNRSPIQHDSRGACKSCLDSDFALQYGFNMYYRAITSTRSLNQM